MQIHHHSHYFTFEGGNRHLKSARTKGSGMKQRLLLSAVLATTALAASAQDKPTIDEIKIIVEQATTYALPMLTNYATMYEYAIDASSPQ